MARCPECNAKLTIPADLEVADRVVCRVCSALLEVVDVAPLELEALYDYDDDDDALDELEADIEDLDWDDDDDDDDDDDW